MNKNKIYSDFYNNITPERVPFSVCLPFNLLAQYGGLDYQFQYDYGKLTEFGIELAGRFQSDLCPIIPVELITNRPPSYYQLLGSQSFVMGSDGLVQHPEVTGMNAEEYAELTKDPYAFIIDKVIPRQYKNLDPTKPVEMLRTMEMAKQEISLCTDESMEMYLGTLEKGNYYEGPPLTANGFTETPYDFIADQLRGFGNISMDIRRHRSEIKEACEALLPLMFNMGLPETPHPEGNVFIPLHMPTFMREKDFVDIYLPTFKTLLEQYAALGVRCCLFCEDDWTRYADILMELPAGTQLLFEYGDAKVLKEKLGKKFILQGLYPVGLLKMGTKQQVIDKAKELLDTMMLGGGYSFAFDKEPMTLSEINLENWIALSEFVSEYGVYKNAGEAYGTPLNSESFVFSEEKIKPIKSKYWFDWDNFKKENPLVPDFAKKRFMKHNKSVFSFYMNLLV